MNIPNSNNWIHFFAVTETKILFQYIIVEIIIVKYKSIYGYINLSTQTLETDIKKLLYNLGLRFCRQPWIHKQTVLNYIQ